MLVSLSNSGLVFKNRHGKYSFAVPLMGQFINRQYGSQMKDKMAQMAGGLNIPGLDQLGKMLGMG